MTEGRIDYQIEKHPFSCIDETPRLTRQWADVVEECRHLKGGAEERLRIAALLDELQLNQKEAIFNGKRFGCVWSPLVQRPRLISRSPEK